VPGAAASHSSPLTCRGTQARENWLVVVRVNKVTIDLRSRHSTKRMHAVQGLWNPSTSSLTRGPLGAWGSLASHPGPLTCRARRARENGLVVRVKVTIDLRSRHSTKRCMPCRGYGILLLVALEGLWAAPCILPLTCGARRARELIGCAGQSYDRFTIAPLDQTNACRAGAMESFY
jgi:hypothetical protein